MIRCCVSGFALNAGIILEGTFTFLLASVLCKVYWEIDCAKELCMWHIYWGVTSAWVWRQSVRYRTERTTKTPGCSDAEMALQN